MAVSVADVMRQCRNYFASGWVDGTFSISGNALPEFEDGYIFISGSRHHDGVWFVTGGYLTGRDVDGMPDEDFTGRVWLLSPTGDFLALCREIAGYDEKNPVGAYQSESFGGYSYTRGGTGAASGNYSWQAAYYDALTPYRRMFTEVG